MITNGELSFFILAIATILTVALKSESPDRLKKIIFALIMMNSFAIIVIAVSYTHLTLPTKA